MKTQEKTLLTRDGHVKKPLLHRPELKLEGNPWIKGKHDLALIQLLYETCVENPSTFSNIIRAKRNADRFGKDILKWISDRTPKLSINPLREYSLGTKLNWIFTGRTDFPTCQNPSCSNKLTMDCGISGIYYRYCCTKCGNSDPKIIAQEKKTTKDLYGDENYRNQGQAKETCLTRFGVSNFTKTRKYKRICKKKQKQSKAKEIETKRRNGTLNTSNLEAKCKDALFEAFGKENVKDQYKSDAYPFYCDFYIKTLNLYLECNFHWTHGSHPFDMSNPSDLATLKKWRKKSKESEYFKNAIDTWTVRDVNKRNVAKENKITYIEFWSFGEFEKWINSLKSSSLLTLQK